MEPEDPKKEEIVGEPVGKVVGFFAHPSVAAIKIEKGSIKVGDTIRIKGHTTDLQQLVESMQIENAPVQEVKPGDDIGIKVKEKVRKGDTVYRL